MTLTYLNAELDATKEHELFKINDFGFKVEINYNEDCWIYAQKKSQVINNVTEIHNLFGEGENDEIAFECDIHAQGFYRKVSDINSVTITLEIENKSKFED
jgi:hypothetical protein